MNAFLKKLHAYAGLLSFTLLLVYGLTGLAVTLAPGPGERPRPPGELRRLTFAVPPNLTDKQLADQVWEHLAVPLSNPVPEWALRRDGDNRLSFAFYTPNGVTRVKVLEAEGQLEVASERAAVWTFLNTLHATTVRDRPVDWRLRAWVVWNEFGIAALLFLALSGVYLWLSSRPRHRWAQVCFAAGTGGFLILSWLSR